MEPGNNLKIESLTQDWRDKDSVMLHACFQLLKDAVEQEHLLTNINWDTSEINIATKKEIEVLYKWWINYQESLAPDESEIKMQNEMLHRLIDIRWALWT